VGDALGEPARGEVGDGRLVEEVFQRPKPQVVNYLAGYIEVVESIVNRERYLVNNSAKSRVLIGAAIRHEVEAFVFSGTCAVYCRPQAELLQEAHKIAPINPYAVSKASVARPGGCDLARPALGVAANARPARRAARARHRLRAAGDGFPAGALHRQSAPRTRLDVVARTRDADRGHGALAPRVDAFD